MNSSRDEHRGATRRTTSALDSDSTRGRRLWVIFVVGTLVNYAWELAQTPLYEGIGSFSRLLWHCLLASLGDGLLVLLIYAAGWIAFRQSDWYVRPGWRGYLLMLATGLLIAVAIEWVAMGVADQWRYSERMPRVLGIGLAPIAQMLILPPLIFRIAAWCPAWWRSRLTNSSARGKAQK